VYLKNYLHGEPDLRLATGAGDTDRAWSGRTEGRTRRISGDYVCGRRRL